MRIWYQSSVALETNPVYRPYKEALERNAQEIVRPDTTVDIHGVERMSPHMEKLAYAGYLNAGQVIESALRAEAEGYDAVAVGCYSDPGVAEIRESIGIPAVFIMQTSLHMAAMLAVKFAVIGYNKHNLRRMRQLVDRYQLDRQLAAIGHFQAELGRSNEWFDEPKPLIRGFEDAAETCAESGAEILIPSCGVLNQVLRENGVHKAAGCPVLDGSSLLLKITEAMADMHRVTGLSTKSSNMSTGVLEEIRQSYGLA